MKNFLITGGAGFIGSHVVEYKGRAFDIFNLGGSRTIQLTKLIALLEAALKKKALIDRRPANPGDMRTTCADIDKASGLLGYGPATDVDRGVEMFVEWFCTRSGTRDAGLATPVACSHPQAPN